jgi:hypothetical protein
MPNPIWLFITTLFKRWWQLMSCAAFTFLGVYVAATGKGNGWVVGGSAFFAVVFFTLAAYGTWKDTYDKYMTEVATNQKPDIHGEAFDFRCCGIHGDTVYRDYKSTHSGVTFELALCNYRPITTTLKNIEVDGSRLTPLVRFEFDVTEALLKRIAFPVGLDLPHGIGKRITVTVEATVDGMHSTEVPTIALDNLHIRIVDAFDQGHPISIKPGERLVFDR